MLSVHDTAYPNVQAMTKALHQLRKEGIQVSIETLRRLSPYLTGHMNRFGEYRLGLDRRLDPVEYHLSILAV